MENFDKDLDVLVELLPDPRTDRYKLTAEIRHDVQSDPVATLGCMSAIRAIHMNRTIFIFLASAGF